MIYVYTRARAHICVHASIITCMRTRTRSDPYAYMHACAFTNRLCAHCLPRELLSTWWMMTARQLWTKLGIDHTWTFSVC